MNFLRLIVVSVSLLYCSCEQLKDFTSSKEDQNKTSNIADSSDAKDMEAPIINKPEIPKGKLWPLNCHHHYRNLKKLHRK